MSGFVGIILSAGRGKRMGSDVPKQYMELQGKPILYYSIEAFSQSDVDSIIIVAGSSDINYVTDYIVKPYGFHKVESVIEGGTERYDSVYNGLREAMRLGARYVMIHDGARPFVDNDTLSRCMANVKTSRACIAGMPVKDTIKVVDGDDVIIDTPDRATLWMAQTPQCFETKLAYDSYRKMIESGKTDGVTDDAMVVESFGGVSSVMIEASYNNIKVTTPIDIIVGEQLL